MSKSLVQMVHELFARVDALEKKFTVSTGATSGFAQVVPVAPQPETITTTTAAPSRKMCPKCGVKPAYFFHVRTCPGSKEEQKNADQNTVRRRDQGTP